MIDAAIRRIWRRQLDLRKFETPLARLKYRRPLRPTIDVSTVDLPLASVLALLERIVRSPLPPYSLERTLGLDGTSYEVTFGRLFVRSEFRWWQAPPPGWEPLRQLLEDVQALVDEASRR